MYGLVNRAVEEMVTQRFGLETWREIKAKAGVEVEVFLSSEGYDDDLTYRLVGAATEVLGLAAEEVLEAFGEHWVLETASRAYPDLMDGSGSTFAEFLENLPDFHARVILILPKLSPPEFWISGRGEGALVLHYRSHRPGLQPFVVGLLRGLAKKFAADLTEVRLLTGRHEGLDHDQFLVRWRPDSGHASA